MQRLVDIAPPEIHAVWGVLSAIPDPEVPVLTITDLGMVRSVERRGEGWVIGFTPTYSGCPATERRCISCCSLTRRGPPTGWGRRPANVCASTASVRRRIMPAMPICQTRWCARAAVAATPR